MKELRNGCIYTFAAMVLTIFMYWSNTEVRNFCIGVAVGQIILYIGSLIWEVVKAKVQKVQKVQKVHDKKLEATIQEAQDYILGWMTEHVSIEPNRITIYKDDTYADKFDEFISGVKEIASSKGMEVIVTDMPKTK